VKGIIFNLLERTVAEEHGEDTWDDLLDDVGSDGVYSSIGRYDDDELIALVAAAAARLGTTDRAVLQWFGEAAIPHLASTYPDFFDRADGLHPFLLSLNDVIHPEVRKLYPGAVVPEFRYDTEPDGTLTMQYESPRTMCDLAVGFARGAATHYGQDTPVAHRSCRLDGDGACVIEVGPSA
jgi:hypothetical protein